MNTLEKLIAQLCPDGVEYKQMGKVAKVCRGVRVVKAQLSKVGKYPVYQNSITPLGYHLERNCKAGTTFVIAAGAAGEIGYCNVDFWAADDCYYIETDKNLNGRFVYYCLLTMRLQLTSKVRKASVPRLARSFVDNLVIPFPPLPVQKEIVRMLDDMAGLIDALEEELAARKQQYEWCRERLLRMEDGVEYKPLGEVCVRHHGTNITAGRMAELACSNGGVRVFAAGSTVTDVPTTAIPSGDVIKESGLIVKSRGYVGFEYYEQPFTHKNELWSYTSGSNDTDLKFVYYYLLTQCLALQALARSKSVKLPQLATGDTDRLEIPIPPLSVQKEIVRMLDEMTGLIDAQEEELALRKQQYEYYRDKLLTFKRKTEVA